MGDDVNRFMFYKSAVIVCDAAILLVKRYANGVPGEGGCLQGRKTKSRTFTNGREPDLDFGKSCPQLLGSGPGHHAVSDPHQHRNADPVPRLGALRPVDLAVPPKGPGERRALTLDQAQEIVDAFFLKANCYYNAGPDKLVKTTGIGNTYQHTTIGGVDPETGEDATNPITYMVLETVGRLKLHDPTISLRINKNSPDKLWECALETSKLVGGLPLFQNDEVIIPSLQAELGFEEKDARNFGIIGCQEIVGCGWRLPGAQRHLPAPCLRLVGVDIRHGHQQR